MESRPLPLGTTLKGRYRVTRLVSGGGMAWVYEVEEHRAHGSRQIWAMKELRADGDDVRGLEESRRLFEQEASILVRLSHPNLPRVSAFFEHRGRFYLVMEFIHGESLKTRLEQANAPLLESQVLYWAIQVSEVLSYLHTRPRPVIFRDMKPSNVMVTPEDRIVLVDFGIARTYKAGKPKDTITMGSENYAAPEQWGQAQTDPRADIYGLGATLYHLLANVPPLPAFVPASRVPIQQYNPAVTHRASTLVERAMAFDRDDRYPSAAEMRAALVECLPRRERRRVEARLRRMYAPRAREPAPQVTRPSAPPGVGRSAPHLEPREKACPRCGKANRPAARFCCRCGYPYVAAMPPVLSVVEPAGACWEYPLRQEETLIGRDGGEVPVHLDVGFYDPEGYISRNHARIAADRRRYRITDLGSTNGTQVNEARLEPHVPRFLRHGDRIRLGRVVLQFQVR